MYYTSAKNECNMSVRRVLIFRSTDEIKVIMPHAQREWGKCPFINICVLCVCVCVPKKN